jgi:glucose/arabinose dehydrogenase
VISDRRRRGRGAGPGTAISRGVLFVLGAIGLALTVLAGRTEAGERPAPTQTYAAYCSECHGAALEGGRGPPLLGARWLGAEARASLLRAVRAGVPERGMPAWADVLDERTVDELVEFILARNETSSKGSVPPATRPDTVVHSQLETFRIETLVASGIDRPTSLAVLQDGRLLVADAAGLRWIADGALAPAVITGLPPHDALQDVAIPPRFSESGWIYLTYVCSAACGHPDRTLYHLARGRIVEGRWIDGQTLARYGDGDSVYGVSKIAFDGRGHVFFTLSGAEQPGRDPKDFAAQIELPQQLSSYRGKIFRLTEDGRVPPDNPFVGRAHALPSIWSRGHRGLSGLYFDRATGVLWSTEHGPWGGDELNRVERGGNYGWPLTSFGYHYAGAPLNHDGRPGLEPPLFHWTPAVGVSNVVVYAGDAFPAWRGHLLVGSLGARIGRTLFRFELDAPQARLYAYPTDAAGRVRRDASGRPLPRTPRYEEVAPDVGRIRDLRVGPDGFVYLLLETPALIVRLRPAASSDAVPPR